MDLECFKLTKQNKSGRERQIYDFTHTWNLRNKTDEHSGREGKLKYDKNREGGNYKRVLTIGNKMRVAGGGGRWGLG